MRRISVPDAARTPMGRRRPSPACRTKRRQTRCSVHEQKRGSMNPLNVYRTHARTHARDPTTHSCAPALCLCPRRSPHFSLSLSQNAIWTMSWTKFRRWQTGKGFVWVGENRSQIETCKETPLCEIGKIVA